MLPKKRKIQQAHDALVTPHHIQQAQQTMLQRGPGVILKEVYTVEPELTGFITAVAKDIAAHALIDCEMPRPVVQQLRERIAALAISVYGAYNLAVYDHYKELVKGTPVAALDAEPEPAHPAPPVPPAPPSTQSPPPEEGGTCVK